MSRIRSVAAAVILGLGFSEAFAAVIINELMFKGADDPDGTDGDLFEYVEIQNTGTAAVDLAGASFSKGITYVFAAGTPYPLGPGAILVFAKDRAAFQRRYPEVTNLAPGVYSGKLANEGEVVTFRLADASTDSVLYGNNGAWPAAAYAFGPSIERLCPEATGMTSVNWMASGTTTGWVQVVWTSSVDVTDHALTLFLGEDGKGLVDEISVQQVGDTNPLLLNGSFDVGMTGWSATNNHGRSRVEPGIGVNGSAALVLQCNESRTYVDPPVYSIDYFGDAVSNHVRAMLVGVSNRMDVVLTFSARRDGLGTTLYTALGTRTQRLVLASAGTPGRANSSSWPVLPIGITSVSHGTNRWPVGIPKVVQAQVSDASRVSSVSLYYQTVPLDDYRFTRGDYAQLPMRDDGMLPDLVAGDGLYAASVPAVSSHWTLVRYHVRAAGTDGFAARSPTPDDPETDFGYWVESASPQTVLPNWHVLVDGHPIMHPFSRHVCAISPEGQVFTDVLAKHRGNPESDPTRTGIGLHCHRTEKFDAWFAPQQKKINFRHRRNDWLYYYRRVIAEPLAYELQRTIGLPTPRLRPICVWFNGSPTITTELEAPEDAFLTGNGLPLSDFVTRQSYSDGIELVGGDTNLDNFSTVQYALAHLNASNRNGFIRSNLWYESVQHSLALVALTGNGDQHFAWNMFQHRSASDGRWQQFPWDVDISFDVTYSNASTSLVTLHPYYRTPLHPSIWDAADASPLGVSLFYPESNDVTTLPYRYRQQMTLWRYVHTLFTTNYLFPRLQAMQDALRPAYEQIRPYETNSNPVIYLGREVTNVMHFITARRDFLLNGDWSDKDWSIWNPTNQYHTDPVVVSEIMHTPANGIPYLELYNGGPQAVDLSRWSVQSGSRLTNLPFGTMLAPTSFLVLAASPASLTNAYTELGDASLLIERYPGTRIWDAPIVFTAATEYASRLIQLPGWSLSPGTGSVTLVDLAGETIDEVRYGHEYPWPDGSGVAIERLDPTSGPVDGTGWRNSAVVGTPGTVNTATGDQDDDHLPDNWEMLIVDASGGSLQGPSDVSPLDDADGDGVLNGDEFIFGTDPLLQDADETIARIRWEDGGVPIVEWTAHQLTGESYARYRSRTYGLQILTNGAQGIWREVPGFSGMTGDGVMSYTHATDAPMQAIGFRVNLRPIRP